MKKLIVGLVTLIVLVLSQSAYAGEVTSTFAWDPNSESYLGGYKLYVSDSSGTGYVQTGEDIPAGTETADFTFTGEGDEAIKKFFVVTAFSNHDPPLESDYSNEVWWIYNFAPYELTAAIEGLDITFSWKQVSIEFLDHWKLYSTETSGESYVELATIEYTGQAGPQYSTTETMDVPEGEIKTFYFVLVAFTEEDPYSENSNEVTVVVDRRKPAPVYNVTITVK